MYLIVNKILQIVIADYGTYCAMLEYWGQPQYIVIFLNNEASQEDSSYPSQMPLLESNYSDSQIPHFEDYLKGLSDNYMVRYHTYNRG